MRLHILALPHTQTTAAFPSCAFTGIVRRFCKMMTARGHEVILYAGDQNDTPCTELVTCFREADRLAAVNGLAHYTHASFNASAPHWQAFNAAAVKALNERFQPKDIICLIGGLAQKPIADAMPADRLVVEFGVGYPGSFAKYRVFHSYAWMHMTYAAEAKGGIGSVDGRWTDAVIPGFIDMDEFPEPTAAKGDYCLYVGRMIDRKGVLVAQATCKRLDKRLLLAGTGGPPPGYGEYVGEVDAAKRFELMSAAQAVFMPTLYCEPFGLVQVEAMACGTPPITTDWGAFPETIVNGYNGFRCRNLREFKAAVEHAPLLDPEFIRSWAINHYSLDAVGPQYEAYFERLLDLYGAGWYA